MNYFTKEVSERIRAMGLEVETGAWWRKKSNGWEITYDKPLELETIKIGRINYRAIPAYDLRDILPIINKIGNKYKWYAKEKCSSCGQRKPPFYFLTATQYHSWKILEVAIRNEYILASEYFLDITKEYEP